MAVCGTAHEERIFLARTKAGWEAPSRPDGTRGSTDSPACNAVARGPIKQWLH